MMARELSIGELNALVLKACRGAGYSWGLSQEAGSSAAWLALRGLPSAEYFAALLDQINGKDPLTLAPTELFRQADDQTNDQAINKVSPKCPVMTGTMISDFGLSGSMGIDVGPVYSPAILIPFVAACAKTAGAGLCVKADQTEILISSSGELISVPEGFDAGHNVSVSITRIENTDKQLLIPQCRRASVSAAQLQTLETYAHLTYVPASDESRSGAGAGLTDND